MQIRLIHSNEFGKLQLPDLEAFERSLGTTLPKAYRDYLLAHNGGYVEGTPELAEIHGVYGIHNGPDHLRLQNQAGDHYGEKSNGILPIAYDPVGNQIVLVIRGSAFGAVCFWDHESGENPAEGIIEIAPDFDSYLRALAVKVALHYKQINFVREAVNELGINAPIYAGKTILDLAFELADLPIITMLVSMGGHIRPDALIEAVRNNARDTIQFLLERHVDVNYVIPETGFTALMLAGSRQLPEIMELLIAHGANPALRNRWGKTATDLAAGNFLRDVYIT